MYRFIYAILTDGDLFPLFSLSILHVITEIGFFTVVSQ
jgi:hypothetical protein